MHMHIHIEDVLPFTPWLRRYNRHYLKADLFAGLTVAVVALPQSRAYAIIAGLPVQYGLYASIVPTIIGCLWGSSAQLITGPTTTASLVVRVEQYCPTGQSSLYRVGLSVDSL